MELNPAAGLQIFVALLNERRPVLDSAQKVAGMDEIELLGIGPIILDIVDFETDIWWEKAWLDGTEVITENLR